MLKKSNTKTSGIKHPITGGPMEWKNIYKDKLVTVDEAAAVIKSGDNMWLPGGASLPVDIMNLVDQRRDQLEDIKIVSGLLIYPYEFLRKEYKDNITYYSTFQGPVERVMYKQGNVNLIANQFSKLSQVIEEKLNCNIALFECSEPDENGYMSYGPTGVLANEQARVCADTIIVQVNKKTPYLYGENAHIHVTDVDYICEQDHDLLSMPSAEPGDDEKKIAAFIGEKIDDGATIQLGIGNIADAVGSFLETKNDIGIHTEMLTNSMVDLIKKGVVTNAKKTLHKDKSLIVFAMGDKQLYDFINKNKTIEAYPTSYVNDPIIIGKHDNFVSINSTLAVDLTGQICSESIGFNQYSGTGGQLDFVRGARYSKGGKSFIALKSTALTKNGPISKICCTLAPGTVVTVPRTEVQYVVTEYGITDMWGKGIRERVRSMISIAHPDFREQLTQEAVCAGLIS